MISGRILRTDSPAAMISLQKNFLFVHVPKTGGNSIQAILRRYSEDEIVARAPGQDGVERFALRSSLSPELRKHATLRQYRAVLGAERLDPFYKFAVVRNPWDRLVSLYFSPHKGRVDWDRDRFLGLLDEAWARPLGHFVSLDPRRPIGADLNFVLRFERLEADFAETCSVLGIAPAPLPRRNASTRRHYTEYYDGELREIVAERYQEEIAELGYTFEAP